MKRSTADEKQPSNVIRWLCLSLFCCNDHLIDKDFFLLWIIEGWIERSSLTIPHGVTEATRLPIWAHNASYVWKRKMALGSVIISHTGMFKLFQITFPYGIQDVNEFSSIRPHLYVDAWPCLTCEPCCSSFRWQYVNTFGASECNPLQRHRLFPSPVPSLLTAFHYCSPLSKLSYPSSLFWPGGKWDVSAESKTIVSGPVLWQINWIIDAFSLD